MNKFRALHRILTDPAKDFNERLFILDILLTWVAMFIIFIIDILLGENILEIVVLAITLVFMGLVSYICVKKHIIIAGVWIIAVGITVFTVPLCFISGGGKGGGVPLWIVMCFVYVGLMMKGKGRFVGVVMLSAEAALLYFLSYHHLIPIGIHSIKMDYNDSLSSVIVVGMVIFLLSWFQNWMYQQEKEIAEKQKKEIEELNKAQNRFFSSMSHEIRTPINTIIGLDEMIMREDISDEVADDARNIRAAGKILLTTINDILDMSKIESGKMEIIPVTYKTGDMLSEIVGMIWNKAKDKGLEFHVDVDQHIPVQLYGDEIRIKQILINLLNNAVKYTSEGAITLSIQERRGEGNRTTIIYSVSDTGMGVKKESLPYLFTAFKRVDEGKNRHIEGTGLGLSIVKQFVDLMGGKITVNSVYTKGSTFTVELPQEIADETGVGDLKIEDKHALKTREHYKQSFEAPDAHILIVDDNDMNIKVVTKLLRQTRVIMDTASSGKEALRLCLNTHFDTIFMDHLMPEMDGIECLQEIRKQAGGMNRETPVVVLTANAGSDNQEIYNRAGFNGYLLKPVSGEDLEAELAKHLPADLVRFTSEEDMNRTGELVRKASRKQSLLISTDSICDLPGERISDNDIEIMPYHIHTGEGYFLDGIEAETEGILAYLEDESNIVRSQAPTPEEYELYFARLLTKAQYVIHITMSGEFSFGYKNALEASENFDNVLVVDSSNVSGGTGLMVLYAAKRAKESVSAEALTKELEGMREKIRTSFVVDNTSFLARTGRISSRLNAISNAFMLHPVIKLKKGKMVPGSILVGTRKKSWGKYIDDVFLQAVNADMDTLIIECSGLSVTERQEIEEQVRKRSKFKEIIVHNVSPTISINCGPHTFGLIYMTK